ncbi:MAG: prepilin-type N-terminal cleavage/methylation domain-containing protein [Firmicutes bacterium]|nr:prepilin-type N-terminal cleavage/methylation domain-containing protein [Bacillota bacterium]
MRKKSKGFTLAELLIVVAIIAVLVAVAIPVFSGQLEKSREATDLANVRSAYAEMMACVNTDEYNPSKEYRVDLKQTKTGWQSFKDSTDNPIYEIFDKIEGTPAKGGYATLHYNKPDEGQLLLKFNGGHFQAAVPARSEDIRNALKNLFANSPNKMTGITSWDSTYKGHEGINGIKDKIKDFGDVKAWTIINSKAKKEDDRFPYGDNAKLNQNTNSDYFDESQKDLYYLWTGVDISQSSMVGKEVPVMVCYTDDEGQTVYTVSDIKVTNGNDASYNVISGKNPRPSGAGYDINNHLSNNRQDFSTNYDEAYAEYQKRLDAMN